MRKRPADTGRYFFVAKLQKEKNMFLHDTMCLYFIQAAPDRILTLFKQSEKIKDRIRIETCTEGSVEFIIPEYNPSEIITRWWLPKGQSSFSCLLTNVESGWPFLIHLFQDEGKLSFLRVRYTKPDIQYPLFEFCHYDNGLRLVRSMKDGERWDFYSTGKPGEYENPDNYRKRKIYDRMNFDIIMDYLGKLKLYLDPGLFLTKNDWHTLHFLM